MSRSSLLACFLVLSCTQDTDLKPISETTGGGGPDIRVLPSTLDFGSLGADDEAVVKQFDIFSIGDEPLNIEDLRIDSEVGSFTILTELESPMLMVGESVTVDVVFEPMAAHSQSGQAVVVSDAELKSEVAVELTGMGIIPELNISPDPLDMGTTYVGCEVPSEVELTNVGTDILEIFTVGQEGDAFQMTSTLSLPLTLEPEESVSVYLNFEPLDAGDVEGSITVTSSEPLGERDSLQLGTGEFGATYEEEWVVPADPPSDIIFYVDQSGSMDDDQARLASNFSTFISELATYSTDWQIIVANADSGCNAHGGVLRPGMVDYESRFQSAVSSGGGFWTEAGLTITSEAVDKTDVGECNYGFLRPDAMLHIIMVSDEPEQSSSSWTWYMDKVIAKKGSSANVKFSAIAGDYPGGCSTAEAGDGYYQPVMATDGVFLSICSDWATPTNLSMLAAASVQVAAFELDATAAPTTIHVYVNETERLTGWHYDEPDNTVVFDEGIPEEGDTVRVTYGGLTVCD
jgi:hypothetical protein